MVPGRLSTPGCFVTIASSPYPSGRSSTSLRISRFMQEERYPTIPLLGARKTVERHHVFQRSDYTSENLFGMTTSTISLVHIAATATFTVVPNSFPIDVQAHTPSVWASQGATASEGTAPSGAGGTGCTSRNKKEGILFSFEMRGIQGCPTLVGFDVRAPQVKA
ncbi:hypothetical protein BKA70DRAFT_1231999 [Coprinopsis sp. MPI-PUGE-AT-0042]|nr:hypothetical protein BKA70DRAFT_1231999 [Coprinopsis sp. MPI-PUGE-AT-0042]